MRQRIIRYLDALFIGMILGLLFVTLVHAAPRRSPAHPEDSEAPRNHIGALRIELSCSRSLRCVHFRGIRQLPFSEPADATQTGEHWYHPHHSGFIAPANH